MKRYDDGPHVTRLAAHVHYKSSAPVPNLPRLRNLRIIPFRWVCVGGFLPLDPFVSIRELAQMGHLKSRHD
jgi:hypothetical protein